MTLFLLHTTTHLYKLPISISISCSSSTPPHNRKIPKLPSTQPHHLPAARDRVIPAATDRVIDFGKHKGKPLGSLPSTYLKWVSQNLRARDFHHWAQLADQVLRDPVYQDRIEWEFAESVLTGNTSRNTSLRSEGESAASRLEELSQRFGWDNEDKVGWSKLDFELLGTSKGGRIPRKVECRVGKLSVEDENKKTKKKKRRELGWESEERRKARDKMGIRDDGSGSFGNGNDQDGPAEIKSPFPGREALLKKVLGSKRFL